VLDRLSKKYKLIMVGAGQVKRIFNQMNHYPIDIIGNYGLQYATYNEKTGEMDIKRDVTFETDKDYVDEKVTYFREKYGFTSFRGDNVEFHPSGCVTFPILGTKAIQEEKLAFDPTREKRRAIYDEVLSMFPDYNVFVGGSSSFDMSPKPFNKYYALDLYCRENGLSHSEVVFIGDDYGQGGNDESVYKSDFNFIKVDNYLDFPSKVKELEKFND
jgi:hydroxymethylpyrimidine pyrophosphatase-like HAD family hydrolase